MCSVPIRDSGGKEHGTHGALCVVGHFQHQVHIEIFCVIRRRGGREPDLCMDMRGRIIDDNGHKTAGLSALPCTTVSSIPVSSTVKL